MLATINEPTQELSQYAPKILTMKINPDKIRDVIGPSGNKSIKLLKKLVLKLILNKMVQYLLLHTNEEMNQKAKKIIEDIVREVEVGEIYLVK